MHSINHLAEARTELAILRDPLLLSLLQRAVNTDPRLEHILIAARRTLLGNFEQIHHLSEEGGLEFLCALAQQCYLNEYLFEETPAETALLEELAARVATTLQQNRLVDAMRLALLACYRPLQELPLAPRLLRYFAPSDSAALYSVLRLQLLAPAIESSLRANIPRLTPIDDAVSNAVRDQYEQNPYPRWLYLDRHQPLPLREYIQLLFPDFSAHAQRWPLKPDVLIAGCGTGKQAISACWRYAGANVLAIDLSLASLGYAARMAAELGCSNIEFAHADILESDVLGRQFDVIECVGVLHHLHDPARGWRALRRRLRPAGLMRIGLYSRQARTAVTLARNHVHTAKLKPDRSGIRAFRHHVMTRPAHDPLHALTRSADFYTLSECRDLAFHVQECTFDLGEISTLLDALNLRFLGFEFADERVVNAFLASACGAQGLNSLPAWQEFEHQRPHTFASMYQFWVQDRDGAN